MRRSKGPDPVDALGEIPLFSGLSRDELVNLAAHATTMDMTEGASIVREGEMGMEAVVILDGTASVVRGGQEIDQVGPGAVIGEMSLLNHKPRNATVTATSNCRLLVMDAREFSSVLEASPELAITILRTMSERLTEHPPD